jgi:hypothetical protein
MASFPTLSTGSIACYPLTRTVSTATEVHRFEDDTEQRYRDRVALMVFELVWTNISESDFALIEAFFDARRGTFDATWDITVNGTLVSNCSFVDDSLSRTENKHGFVSGSLRIRQTRL